MHTLVNYVIISELPNIPQQYTFQSTTVKQRVLLDYANIGSTPSLYVICFSV